MNTLAKEGKDFFFIINYRADSAYIEEFTNIDPRELLFSFQLFLIYQRPKATATRLSNGIQNHPQEKTMSTASTLSSKESVKATAI